MAKLNLKKHSARSLQFHTDLHLSLKTAKELFGEYDDTGSLAFSLTESYSRESTHHQIFLIFVPMDDAEETFHLFVDYSVLNGVQRKRDKSILKPSDVISALSEISDECEFDVLGTFDFESAKSSDIMRLPISLGDSDYGLFDLIHGLRLEKLAKDGNTKYSIIIDTNEDDLSHSIRFKYRGVISETTMASAFESAIDISNSFRRVD